jgi:probable F420-dependent oxidoreductase
MKYGIALPNFGKYADKDKILELASAAEELGYESLWVSDHVVIPGSHEGFGDTFYDPFTTLTYIAAATNKIMLGTSVLILPYRNPVVLAKTVATLDTLSRGRVILGVGAGWLHDEFRALGVDYGERGAITDEYIEIIKTLWTGDSPEFTGKYFKFSDIKFLPKPEQKPHPPIWVGGGSAKAMERAVSQGDGWHPVGQTPRELREKVSYLKGLLDERNRDKSEFTISIRRILEITDKTGIDENETLRGSVEKIARGIEEYMDAGVSHFVFHLLGGDFKRQLRTMEVFSREIMR